MSIMLGADPEFEVYNSRKEFVSAGDVIGGYTSAKFGTDGASDTGELRTDPGIPSVVLHSIDSLLGEGYSHLQAYQLYAGAGKHVPLGGHIHFSGVGYERNILASLDVLIALPLRRISNQGIRDRENYGRESSYKTNLHGWEYRAPCSWISHPIIAESVLEISYIVANAININRFIEFYDITSFKNYVVEKNYPVETIEKINRFYAVIDRMAGKGLTLEQVEIFQAWRKKPRENTIGNKIKYTWVETDLNIQEIKVLVEKRTLRHAEHYTEYEEEIVNVRGAAAERSSWDALFIPSTWRYRLPRTIAGVRVNTWGDNSTNFGLSLPLRQNIQKSVDVLNSIKWLIPYQTFKQGNLEAIKVIEEV